MFLSFNRITYLLIVLLTSLSFAQKPNYKFKAIAQSDGLVNSTIMDLYEDSFGFMWIATQQGVQRYDGITFKTFRASDDAGSGLWTNFSYSLTEDGDGNIWICNAGGINKYVRKYDRIIKYKLEKDVIGETDDLLFLRAAQDGINKDVVWFVGTGVLRINSKTHESKYYSAKLSDFSLTDNYGYRLTNVIQNPVKSDELLLCAENLFSFDKETGEIKTLLELEQNTIPPNNIIQEIAVDPANHDVIWLATGDIWGRGTYGGIIKFNLRTGRKEIYSSDNRPGELTAKHIVSIEFLDKDNLWIGSRENGAFFYNKNEDKFYNYKNNKLDPESIVTSQAVLAIKKDKSGSIWFGTWGDGISILSSASQKFTSYKHLPNEETGLLDNYVLAFAEDKNGNIWIGTESGGLTKYNPKLKTFENFYGEFTSEDNPITITSLHYDSRDNLWIGTFNDALHRFNPSTKTKIHYKSGKSNANVSQRRITAITEFKPGEIIISTYGGGLNIYNYSTNSFKHYLNDPNDSTSIPDNQMWLPFLGDDGNYYFSGNSTAGLFGFNPETEKFEAGGKLGGTSTFTMPNKSRSGKIYINSVSDGLQEIDLEREEIIKTLYDNEGNSIDNVESILEDSNGKLWLGTGNGLLEYDPQLSRVKRYDIDDGLQGYTFERLAALKASSGEMYFGGTNGFSHFHPDEVTLSSFQPRIVFIDFKLYQESVNIGENSILDESILVSDKIQLSYDQNDFTIEFAVLDFSNPKEIKYKYILENHDADWIDAGQRNYASYTNMDPGEYKLKVLATNSDGVWVNEPQGLSIIIHPPIWQTTGAYIFYALLLIGGIITVDRVQRKRLVAKERIASQIREAELRAQIAEKENERKTYELEEARKLQLSMLPKEIPQLQNLDIAVYMKTATEVGGDYYDFHVHLDGTLTVVLGDATGHGMQSGMMVSIMKSLFMSDRSSKDLKPFFQNSNHSIKDMHLGRLMMALTCIQFNSNRIKIANAGMPSLFIYRNNKKSVDEISINNLPLGAMKDFEYEIKEERVESGDTLLLMSDGFAELKNDDEEMIGYRQTRNLFEEVSEQEPEKIINHLNEFGNKWTNDKENDDDITFVVIKVK
ncbi:MAG: SpoIIE family protein phosphatase [Melioribacteraceae bacterium]|nr:SpoIIE family protein phosphatase [Melioribacteraceae bacterium]